MACDITKGRLLPCKDTRTGIKHIDFAVFDEYGFTVSAQEIATLPVSLEDVFRYQVKGTANKLDEALATNMDNRTSEVTQTLNAMIQKSTKETEVELLALMYGRVVAFVHDFNGNVKVCGITNGLDGTTATFSTDTNGYAIALEGKELRFAPVLSSSAKTALEALVSASNVTP